MTTTNNSHTDLSTDGHEPVLRIRPKREWYGAEGISIAELTYLTDIPQRLLESFELWPVLPALVENLLRIAFALQLPVEELVAPEVLERLRSGIALRRSEREEARDDIGFRCPDDDNASST